LLEAPTRAGKGVGVVVPNLLEWPDSVVVLDVKQENWDLTAGHRRSAGQTVLLFNPLDTTGKTVRFNPLAYIDRHNEIEVINELQKIAAMLFPSQPGESSFWMDAARTAFIGVGGYVAATAIKGEKGRPFTIGEIYRNLKAVSQADR
jgi:type IV secretion system protein VirD4